MPAAFRTSYPSSLFYVPLLVLAPGYGACAASARLGGQTKLLDGQATAEAQGTLAVGGAGDHAGNALFLPVRHVRGPLDAAPRVRRAA